MAVLGAFCEGRRVPAVTIFGWDDVLCPTTHAKLERDKRIAPAFGIPSGRDDRKELLKVGASVVRCVRSAQRHGPVVIVTESDEQWVRGTAKLLLPGSAAACLKNVEVISSKARFGKDFPGQPACWQIAAFSYVTNRHLLSSAARAEVGLVVDGTPATATEAATAAAAAAAAAARKGRGNGVEGDGESGSGSWSGSRSGSGVRSGGRGARGTGDDGAGVRAGRGDGDSGGGNGAGGGGGSGSDETAKRTERLGSLVAVSTAPRAWEDKSATCTLREHHPQIVPKTVSLMETPTPLELRKQLDLLAENFELMFGHPPPREQCADSSDPSLSTSSAFAPPRKQEQQQQQEQRQKQRQKQRQQQPQQQLSSQSSSGLLEKEVVDFDEEDYATATSSTTTSSTEASVDGEAVSPVGSAWNERGCAVDKGSAEQGQRQQHEQQQSSSSSGGSDGSGTDALVVTRATKVGPIGKFFRRGG